VLETASAARYSQYETDERLWRLEPYVLEEVSSHAKHRTQDYPGFTSNETSLTAQKSP